LTRKDARRITDAPMPTFVLPFPVIDPILIQLGPLAIRWYALAYIAGLIAGWALIRRIVANDSLWGGAPRPTSESIDDLLVYCALGVVVGGRLGSALFYNPAFYAAHPLDVLKVWQGGMSFHGGLAGAVVGILLFARRYSTPVLTVMDLASIVAPIGIFLGRIANFIKPELWGRPTDVPWAMIFPGAPDDLPRHPSQLYEAMLEGVAIFVVLNFAARAGALRRPGLIAGMFGALYGLARTFVEFFREPDPGLDHLPYGVTMGMLLSAPMIAIGLALVLRSLRAHQAAA
jgi:phosphatidylglycerol:prolipoprotein diacylglycerol transferase